MPKKIAQNNSTIASPDYLYFSYADLEGVIFFGDNIEDNEGRPIWRRSTEAMPGKLDLYPYHEVNILPQIADIKADAPVCYLHEPEAYPAWKPQGH